MNTHSAITGPYTEKPLWYDQSDLRQSRILRENQPVVEFHAADNCRLFNTTTEAMNFQDDIPQFQLIISETTMY